jgi:hypothetical protein
VRYPERRTQAALSCAVWHSCNLENAPVVPPFFAIVKDPCSPLTLVFEVTLPLRECLRQARYIKVAAPSPESWMLLSLTVFFPSLFPTSKIAVIAAKKASHAVTCASSAARFAFAALGASFPSRNNSSRTNRNELCAEAPSPCNSGGSAGNASCF